MTEDAQNTETSTTTPEIDALECEIIAHNYHYWVRAQPIISDYAYDVLVENLRKIAPNSPVIHAVGTGGAMDDPTLRARIEDVVQAYPPPEELEQGHKVEHDVPMLSLEKCYDEETLLKWFEKFEGNVVVSPKIDGIAASFKYREGKLILATTRGDGKKGEWMTESAREIVNLPSTIDAQAIEVRGEAYMPLHIFKKDYAAEFANPRNLTAGALKQKKVERTRAYRIHFFAYDLIGENHTTEVEKFARLRSLGFDTVETHLVEPKDLQATYDALLARRDEFDYDTDGVVYKANRVDEQQRLGSNSHHPRFAIAYKFQGDSGTSVLRGVEWSVSRTGTINPVALIDPVSLSGATITRVSLHNLSIMEKLGDDTGTLYLNSEIVVMRRGGVIPHIENVAQHATDSDPVEIPSVCPDCGAPTKRVGDFMYAEHKDSCRTFKMKEIEYYVKVCRIDNLGEKLIAQLYDNNLVRSIPALYSLTVDQLLPLDRMGEKLASKVVRNIQERRELEVATFLRALAIHELGKHVSAILAETCSSMDEIFALTPEGLASIHTIGDVIAKHVVEGLVEKRPLIDLLLKEVNLTFPSETTQDATLQAQTALTGKSYLFTGTMTAMTRKDAQQLVLDQGGLVASGVSKNLDFLVLGNKDMERFNDGWRSSKLKKAEKIIQTGAALKIISEDDFITSSQTSQAPETEDAPPAEPTPEDAPPAKTSDTTKEDEEKQTSLL